VRKVVGGAALAAAVVVAALGAGFGQAATTAKVTVDMREFGFTVKPKTVAKGVVVFTVANKGKIGHDFRIAGKKTPLILAGGKRTLRVTIAKAGRYAYLCTLPSHATAGMKGVLVVK